MICRWTRLPWPAWRHIGLGVLSLWAVCAGGGGASLAQQEGSPNTGAGVSSPAQPTAPNGTPRGVALRAIDGGPEYFARWPASLPTRPSFFPIAVWFESVVSARDVDLDQAAGFNTYVVLTANSDASLVAARGMHFVAHHGEWLSRPSMAIRGWELDDEVDMRFPAPGGFRRLTDIVARIPADGRFRYANYGKGVAFWLSETDASRYVNAFPHVVSVDNYWFTDGNICSASEGGRLIAGTPRRLTEGECRLAANYGHTVDRVRHLDGMDRSRQPVWAFVEVGHPFSENHWPSITPAQMRAAVWHSLIAGARGIMYFNHSFGGPCPTQHALREPCYASIREAVQATNRQITALAPVLNSL